MIINQLSSEAFSSFSRAAAAWNRILGCCPLLASWLTSSPHEGCAVSIRLQGRTYLFMCIDIALTWRTHSKLQITLLVTLDALCWILHGHIDLVTAPLFMAAVGKEQNGYITHKSIHAGVSEGKRGWWASGKGDSVGSSAGNTKAMWPSYLCVHASLQTCVNAIRPQA